MLFLTYNLFMQNTISYAIDNHVFTMCKKGFNQIYDNNLPAINAYMKDADAYINNNKQLFDNLGKNINTEFSDYNSYDLEKVKNAIFDEIISAEEKNNRLTPEQLALENEIKKSTLNKRYIFYHELAKYAKKGDYEAFKELFKLLINTKNNDLAIYRKLHEMTKDLSLFSNEKAEAEFQRDLEQLEKNSNFLEYFKYKPLYQELIFNILRTEDQKSLLQSIAHTINYSNSLVNKKQAEINTKHLIFLLNNAQEMLKENKKLTRKFANNENGEVVDITSGYDMGSFFNIRDELPDMIKDYLNDMKRLLNDSQDKSKALHLILKAIADDTYDKNVHGLINFKDKVDAFLKKEKKQNAKKQNAKKFFGLF